MTSTTGEKDTMAAKDTSERLLAAIDELEADTDETSEVDIQTFPGFAGGAVPRDYPTVTDADRAADED